MTRFAPVIALVLSAILAVPAAAVDTGDGGDGGGGGTGGDGEATGAKSASQAAPFTPLDQARGAVRERRYDVALRRLTRIVTNEPQNADAWNLLGFTYRALGQLDQASAAYLQALAIDPNHLGALEYQGELFITQGNLAAARDNLDRLNGLCGDCEEAQDLAEALAGT